MRIGYLLNRYPALSHTFILREVLALRALGVDVETFSIHRSDPDHLLAERDHDEHARTRALRPVSPPALATAHVHAITRHPRAYLRALRTALAVSGPSLRALTWQIFYFAEAVPLWLAMREAGCDSVHAHFTTPAADVAMLIAELGNGDRAWTWSFSAHGSDIQECDRGQLEEKVRRATRVICVSDFGRSQLMALVEPELWPKLHVVHCGIDPRAYSCAPRAGQTVRVLNVGRLVALKGHALLLEAIAEIRRRGVEVALTIVGDGPLRPALESTTRELGMIDCVEFAGNVGQDEIGEHYRTADLFCLPSLLEGVPVVLMEAMASCVPVIATQTMGIPELVEHDRTGILVRPGRVDALAREITRLAEDRDLRLRLGAAGRTKVANDFDVRACAAQLAAVFESMSERSPSDA